MKRVWVQCSFVDGNNVHDVMKKRRITGTTIKGTMRYWYTRLNGVDRANHLFGSSGEGDNNANKAKVDIIVEDKKKMRYIFPNNDDSNFFYIRFQAISQNEKYIDDFIEALQIASILGGLGEGKRKLKGNFRIINIQGELNKQGHNFLYINTSRIEDIYNRGIQNAFPMKIYKYIIEKDSIYDEYQAAAIVIRGIQKDVNDNIKQEFGRKNSDKVCVGAFRVIDDPRHYKTSQYVAFTTLEGRNDVLEMISDRMRNHKGEFLEVELVKS